MTKVFSVIYDVGSYSDRSVSLSGVFSSEEKAQAFIDEKSFRPDLESKREEWNLFRETEFVARVKYNERIIVEQNTLLDFYRKEVKKAKNPDFHSNNICRTIETISKFTDNDPRVEPYYLQTLEAYINNKYWTPDKTHFWILESTLDVEIK